MFKRVLGISVIAAAIGLCSCDDESLVESMCANIMRASRGTVDDGALVIDSEAYLSKSICVDHQRQIVRNVKRQYPECINEYYKYQECVDAVDYRSIVYIQDLADAVDYCMRGYELCIQRY